MIETVLYTAYAVLILSVIFIPFSKKSFYIYLLIASTVIIVLWGYIIFELKYCPSYWISLGVLLVSPFIVIPTIVVVTKINTKLNDKELREYVIDRFLDKFFTKSFIAILLMVVLFQLFLLLSANKAYGEAKKINSEYVKGKTVLDFYRPSLHKPFVKEIYIDSETRWSYHRECYLNEWK